MPTGKLTKQGWTQQLDELVPKAGSSFNKASAWDKLDQRLSGKTKERKPIWIWWAAAAIAVLTSLFFILNDNDTEKTELAASKKKKPENTLPLPVSFQQPTAADKKFTGTAPGNSRPYTVGVEQQKETHKNNKPELIQANNNTFHPEIAVIQTSITTDTPAVKATALAAPVTAKRKLAVVHNNELTGPQPVSNSANETMTTVANAASLIPGFKKPVYAVYSSNNDESPKEVKQKKSILPFGSLISKKE